MSRVRTYRRTRGGRSETVRRHDRRGGDGRSSQGMRLRPRRAWHNAKRAHLSAKRRKHLTAAVFATAAVMEIAAFTVFRAAGGILFVTGLGICLIGAGLKART